jgi:hypothetical protein
MAALSPVAAGRDPGGLGTASTLGGGISLMSERLELRSEQGHLLGVVCGGTAIEIKRGPQLYMIDLRAALAGAAVVIEPAQPEPQPQRGASNAIVAQ